MKTLIVGIVFLFLGVAGLISQSLIGSQLLAEFGFLNGRRNIFYHLSFFGFIPLYNTFLVLAILGFIICIACLAEHYIKLNKSNKHGA